MGADKQKSAFITGVTGQDGAHLAAHLLADGWRVYGGFRRGSSNKTWRMDALGITKQLDLVECQLSEQQNLIEILQAAQPDEIYNLAGESFVADSFKYPGVTLEVNTHGSLNLLEAARLVSPHSRMFFASSSEIFGRSSIGVPHNETSPCLPSNPYGVSKLAAQNFVSMYRESYGLFACSGILFNHEGPLRGREFVTRKITFNMARLKVEGGQPIELGNLDAARDWGAAEDYVEAMRVMLGQDEPRDMVIASGKLTTVREFLGIAARAAGFDPVFDGQGRSEVCTDRRTGQRIAEVAERYFRSNDTPPIAGDPTLIETTTSWRRKIELEQMIFTMVEADIDRWKKGLTNV
ncbi:MAG: GDP-mannose 4,6-dehydratase [Gammaproteobacteria bacterium]